MVQDLHKGILNFLIEQSQFFPQGNHLRRLTTLAGLAHSIILGRSCSPTKLGSAMIQEKSVQVESQVKKIERFVSNKWVDWQTHYAPYISMIINKIYEVKGELIIIIDGSETGNNCVSLMVSVVWGKRSIPIAWITKQGPKGHFPESMHIELVSILKSLVPKDCRTVLLGDGEFDGGEFINLVSSKEFLWEYVLRTSLDRKIKDDTETYKIGDLKIRDGSDYCFVECGCGTSNAILWHGRKYKEPIPLLTNMDLAEMACEYYKRRFAIETLFKDIKSSGFNLHLTKMTSAYRISNMLIAICLAYVHTFMIGGVVEQDKDKKIFLRADRSDQMTLFKIGLKFIEYILYNPRQPFFQISKNFWCFFQDSA